jgi:hypothetical protein
MEIGFRGDEGVLVQSALIVDKDFFRYEIINNIFRILVYRKKSKTNIGGICKRT